MDLDYPRWNFGLNFSMPLGGNKKGHSELSAAYLRQEQVLQNLKDVENSMINGIHVAVEGVNSAYDQVKNMKKAYQDTLDLMTLELQKQNRGRSSTKQVLDRETNVIRMRESLLESEIAYKRALIALYIADGSILPPVRVMDTSQFSSEHKLSLGTLMRLFN